MIRLSTIQSIIGYMTLFFAYLIAITPAGFFRAWVAKKMGDDTQEEYGLLSLNPLDHVDPIALIFLFLMHFGWGRFVPVNIKNIRGKYQRLKLTAALFADTLAYVALCVIAVTIIILLRMGPLAGIDLAIITRYKPSLINVLVSILATTIQLSVFLIIVRFISSITTLLSIHLLEKYPDFSQAIYYLSLFLPLVLLLLLGDDFGRMLISFLTWIDLKVQFAFGIY